MGHLESVNQALDYIEEHLIDEIEYDELVRLAGFSLHHLQRLFGAFANTTLAEYVRTRRMSLAAEEIRNGKVRVIDLAMKYGYDSPSSFTRAFRDVMGMTPTEAKKQISPPRSFPRILLCASTKEVTKLEYRIEHTEEYSVFGKSISIGMNDNVFEIVPRLWKQFQIAGTYGKLCRTAGFEPYSGRLLSGAFYNSGDARRHRGGRYMIHTTIPPKVKLPPEFDTLVIPKSKWVVFSVGFTTVEESTPAMQNLWRRIYAEWYPTTPLTLLDGPQLEVIQSYTVEEIWLPVSG